MKRLKIKLSNPDQINTILLKAKQLGYKYNSKQHDYLKYAQCLLLHPEYGLYPCLDQDFTKHIDFKEIEHKEFIK